MIDLTLNDKDRDSFITNLYLKENSDKYIVKYASGRLEEQLFSVHNFNASLYRMEEQFLEFKNDYIMNNLRIQGKFQLKKLVEALLAILGVYVTVNLPIPVIIQGILIGILAIYSFLYQVEASRVVDYGRATLGIVNLADKFMEMKDKFKIKITDPKSGEEEDWYLITLSGIEQINGLRHLNFLENILTDETKELERQKTEDVLENRMCL